MSSKHFLKFPSLRTRKEVPVSPSHGFRLMTDPGIDHPLINAARGTIDNEAVAE